MKINRNIALFLLSITTGIFIFRIILAFQGHFLEQVSGSWAALAVDLSKGMLYRPLFDDVTGSGGTRWMPLYFALHALLIKVTGDVLLSGHLLSLFSSFMLLGAVALLLKHYKIHYISSIVIMALILCSNNLITAMTAVRGDILAAALNVWGIWFAVTSERRPRRIVLSALFFSLTVITKITSVFGIAAVVLWLFFNNRKTSAAKFAGIFSIFTILFVIIVELFSSGRFIEIFTLCASGGTTIVKFVKSPFNFINCVSGTDTGVIMILTTGLTIMIYKWGKILKSPYALYMAVTLALTIFIFGSEGIVGNHLIDLHIASVLVIAGFISEMEIESDMVIKCSIIVIVLAFFINAYTLRQVYKKKPLLASVTETAAAVQKSKLIISENPWLPIIMKRDIYMLDPWMFRVVEMKNPEILSKFYKKLNNGEFDALVFDQNPLAPWIPEWFDYSHFGRNFMNHVFMNYKFRENHDLYHVYTLKTEKKDEKSLLSVKIK